METLRKLAVIGCCVAISGCSQGSSGSGFEPSATSGARVAAVANGGRSFELLHSFTNKPDGAMAVGSLIDVNGTLYGTTVCGGHYGKPICKKDGNGPGGTVYTVDSSGKVTIVHSFGGPQDAANSNATLLYAKGTLYGTTFAGGTYGKGAIFSMNPDGTAYRVLHNFGNGQDGAVPGYGVVEVKGYLYSTTAQGGTNGQGTVFRIGTTGSNYSILHNFGSTGDGSVPLAGLLYLDGRLYGTTVLGGDTSAYAGVVFSVTTQGDEDVLHEFGRGTDGSNPSGNGLIGVGKTIYGATDGGGTAGAGTIFRMTAKGAVTIVHNMTASPTDPNGGLSSLMYSNGSLYGTSRHGGTFDDGTVFSVDPTSGNLSVLHSFGADHSYATGFYPLAAPIAANGKLYGATLWGGTVGGKFGDGTIYALKL
ncbi:MAG TPA: choice-of-anchor tandem repeat GloVer-containing protein [Candidatus Tumulicola sp.]